MDYTRPREPHGVSMTGALRDLLAVYDSLVAKHASWGDGSVQQHRQTHNSGSSGKPEHCSFCWHEWPCPAENAHTVLQGVTV